MKLIHESVIQRREIFQALRAGFFQAFEKEHLCTGVELFEQMAELSHSIAAGWHAEDIMNKTLNKLLGYVFAGYISFRQFSGS